MIFVPTVIAACSIAHPPGEVALRIVTMTGWVVVGDGSADPAALRAIDLPGPIRRSGQEGALLARREQPASEPVVAFLPLVTDACFIQARAPPLLSLAAVCLVWTRVASVYGTELDHKTQQAQPHKRNLQKQPSEQKVKKPLLRGLRSRGA